MNSLRDQIDQAVMGRLSSGSIAYRTYVSDATERLNAELRALAGQDSVELMASGSAAIECGLRAGGIGAGDRVAISAYDYPGNFWAIERVGARPVLIDVSVDTWQPDTAQLASAIDKQTVAAAIVSHLHGGHVELSEIRQRCDARGVLLVEDACQSAGVVLANTRATFGHMVALSFGGGKQLSCGRGGALFTESAELAQKVKLASGAGSGPYTLSELQAEVLLAQLQYLEPMEAAVCEYFGRVAEEFSKVDSSWKVPWAGSEAQSYKPSVGFYQAGFLAENSEAAGRARQSLADNGIRAGAGFVGFHRRSSRRCDRAGSITVTPELVGRTVVVHHDVALEDKISSEELVKMVSRGP